MGKRIVIIGGVAAGPKAAARARRLDPSTETTIVEMEDSWPGHLRRTMACK
jgi:protoporphyrinogen oxidase